MSYVYLPNPPFPSVPSLLPLCCRIFVVGIGFFSLCFLMTSLGGQFSAKRLGDSPFTIRTEGMFSRKLAKFPLQLPPFSVNLPAVVVSLKNPKLVFSHSKWSDGS